MDEHQKICEKVRKSANKSSQVDTNRDLPNSNVRDLITRIISQPYSGGRKTYNIVYHLSFIVYHSIRAPPTGLFSIPQRTWVAEFWPIMC